MDKKDKNKNFRLKDDKVVKVVEYSNSVRIRGSIGGNSKPVMIKGKNNTFIDTRSGVVKQGTPPKKYKGESKTSMWRTAKSLKELIYYNIVEPKRFKQTVLFDLTFRKKTLDFSYVEREFKAFAERLNIVYEKEYGVIDWIMVNELDTDRNGLHIHGAFVGLHTTNSLFFDFLTASELWGNGFIKLIECKPDCDFHYILPHKTDSTDPHAIKMNEKYELLKLLPIGVDYYHTSKGIKRPPERKMTKKEFKEKYGCDEPDYVIPYYKQHGGGKTTHITEVYKNNNNGGGTN